MISSNRQRTRHACTRLKPVFFFWFLFFGSIAIAIREVVSNGRNAMMKGKRNYICLTVLNFLTFFFFFFFFFFNISVCIFHSVFSSPSCARRRLPAFHVILAVVVLS